MAAAPWTRSAKASPAMRASSLRSGPSESPKCTSNHPTPLPAVGAGRHGGIGDLGEDDDARLRSAGTHVYPLGRVPEHAHVAAGAHPTRARAMLAQRVDRAVDRVSLGDATEIEAQ